MKFPSIRDVAAELVSRKRFAFDHMDLEPFAEDENWVDVRLQVYDDGDWAIRIGDSQYDLDHRGYWGCGSISRRANCRDLAVDLIDQVKDEYACNEANRRETVTN